MLSVLHNDNCESYIGLPRDPAALYNELIKQKPKIDKLAGKPSGPKIISKDQMKLIYPSSKTTDSNQFDITLTVILIRHLLKLPNPQARWDIPPKANDHSITANILRSQQLRNFFAHNKPDKIDTHTLDAKFTIGEQIMNDLHYTKCDAGILKTEILDRRTYSMITSFTQKERNRLDDVEKRVDSLQNSRCVAQLKVNSVAAQLDVENVDSVGERVQRNEQRLDLIEGQEHIGRNQIEIAIEERLRAARSQETGEIGKQIDQLYQVSSKNEEEIGELMQVPNTVTENVGRIEKLEDNYKQRSTELIEIKEKLEDNDKQRSTELIEIKEMVKEVRESVAELPTDENYKKIYDEMRRKRMSDDEGALKIREIPSNLDIENDGTSHFHFIKNSNSSIWTHHSKHSNPTEVLHSFQRTAFIPKEIRCELYECGYTKYYQEYEMDEHHLRHFRQLFSEDMKNQPWLLTNLYVDCVENSDFYEFAEKLQTWLANKEYSFLLLNYSCEEHLRMLNVNVSELKYFLQNSNLEMENEHMLVYVAEDSILMNIRFVFSSDLESETKTVIDQAVSEVQNDIKLFACLHMDILEDYNITIVSVIVLNNMTRKDVPDYVCAMCSNTLIITRDEWLKESVLQRKLDTIIVQKRKIYLESKTPSSSSSVADHFEKFSSRLWGWLCTRDVYLPNLSIHGPSSLARIYLNAEQLRFMHLKQRHLMLKGPYGSGKSIMGMTKFRQLAVKATSATCLYFICCSSNTMYTALMKSRLLEMLEEYLSEEQLIVLNLDEYAEQFHLFKPVMLSSILMDMAERHKQKRSDLGIIFDEYDASSLTKQEAYSIDMALLELNDSHVIIMCQSMETMRTKVTKQKSGLFTKKDKKLYDAFMFDSTNIQIETLHLTMRNCTRVNELSRVAIDIIENSTNEFFDREMVDNEGLKYTDDSAVFNPAVGKEEAFNSPAKETNKECITENLEPDPKKTSLVSDKETHFESGSKDYPPRRNMDETLIVGGLFDHLIKDLGNSSQAYTGVLIKSSFKFPGKWLNGHSVEGDIPQLVYPFGNDEISYDNVNSFENKVRMGFALKSLIDIPTRLGNIGVICFDLLDAQLFHNALIAMDLPVKLYAPMLFPTEAVEVAPDLRELAQSHIVITDHIGAQGLELNQLIVSIDPNEKYVHQYLVEAVTRCINTLFILLISKQTVEVKEQGGVCKRIVDNWVKKNLVEVSKIISCKVHLKNDIESPVCEDEKKKGKKTYRVHHWHKNFESCTAINDCEMITVDFQSLAQISKTITNTHYIKEAENKKTFSYISNLMQTMDMQSFANKYKEKQLRKIQSVTGETLLDVARKKFLRDYIVWLESIGVKGSPVRLQCHRGHRDKVTVDKDNVVQFKNSYFLTTLAAPGGIITTGAKAMYEVIFSGVGSTRCCIGWATPRFVPKREGCIEDLVGRCEDSYSFNPLFGNKYHQCTYKWGTEVGASTTKVLGVAADLQSGSLLYAWDGKWEDENMGVAFDGLPPDISLFPVICCYKYEGGNSSSTLKVNLGDYEFKFKPPDGSFRGINNPI